MSIVISVPSKTFIVGEYAALNGGPALVLCTAPRFKLIATPIVDHKIAHSDGIHPDSPAGKFIDANWNVFQKYSLQFRDPYQGLGGLGASTAQFVAVHALKQNSHVTSEDAINAILTEYVNVAWDGIGFAPSGADVIAQIKGKICFSHPNYHQYHSFSWPFPEIDFCLLHTGHKLATHEHLKTLTDFERDDLQEIVLVAKKALENKESGLFADAINHYAQTLQLKHLVSDKTQAWLNIIQMQVGVLAAKGCGALGSDIILILLKKASIDDFTLWATQQNFRIINAGNTLSPGVMKTSV